MLIVQDSPIGKDREILQSSITRNPLSLFSDSFVTAAESLEGHEDMEITMDEEAVGPQQKVRKHKQQRGLLQQ